MNPSSFQNDLVLGITTEKGCVYTELLKGLGQRWDPDFLALSSLVSLPQSL